MPNQPQYTPFSSGLVNATESGAFFRGPLSIFMRICALAGGVPVLAFIDIALEGGEWLRGPSMLMAATCAVAALLGAQVLIARADRLMAAPPARFPVVPAFREFVRGFAEAGFVWSMTLCTGGLVGGVWAAVQLDEVGIPFLESIRSVIAIEVAVATVGWVGLFSVHLWTELTSVIVEIANNGQPENRAGWSRAGGHSLSRHPTSMSARRQHADPQEDAEEANVGTLYLNDAVDDPTPGTRQP